MSYDQVRILEKDGVKELYFPGIDWSAKLTILEMSEKAVMVVRPGHVSYLNRMSGSRYFPGEYMVFVWEVFGERVKDYSGQRFEFTRAQKNKKQAEKDARELFNKITNGEVK